MKKLPRIRMPHITINYKKLIRNLVIIGVLLISISGYVAYNRIYLTNSRRFWMAIENNLAVSSVVREVQQGGTGNKTIDRTRFTFGSQAITNKISSVSQKTATSESNVTTETLQTPTSQYVRYLNIATTEKKEDGSTYNFDNIRGIWAKQSEATTQDENASALLSYAQPHITLAPFGNLSPTARKNIYNALKSSGAYDIDYKGVTNEEVDGIKYLLYPVKVQTKKYVAVLQQSLTAMGFGDFPPLNPDNYPANARVNAQFLVNKKSNVLAGIVFNGISERYTNFGVTKKIDLPANAIPMEELQSKLQALQ